MAQTPTQDNSEISNTTGITQIGDRKPENLPHPDLAAESVLQRIANPITQESLKPGQLYRNEKVVVVVGGCLILVLIIIVILFVINLNIMPKIAQAFYTATPTPTEMPTPTLTPTATLPPTPTHDPNRYNAVDDSFSMIIPEGWKTRASSGKYKDLIGPYAGNDNLIIGFTTQKIDVSLSEYSSLVQDAVKAKFPDLTTISYDSFVTHNGLPYFRWVTVYTSIVLQQSTYYFFDNGELKLMINYVRGDQTGAEYDAVVDKAINTIRFSP